MKSVNEDVTFFRALPYKTLKDPSRIFSWKNKIIKKEKKNNKFYNFIHKTLLFLRK
jgi:hypothetical protein